MKQINMSSATVQSNDTDVVREKTPLSLTIVKRTIL